MMEDGRSELEAADNAQLLLLLMLLNPFLRPTSSQQPDSGRFFVFFFIPLLHRPLCQLLRDELLIN